MGVTSLSQTVSASFLPLLSGCQDDSVRFHRMMSKTHRFTAYITFPCLVLLIISSESIFHTLFGTKWDDAILLFRLLTARGVFVVLTSLYNVHLTAIGEPRRLVQTEAAKDILAVAAIIATIPFGIEWLVGGQVIAAAIHYCYSLWLTARTTSYRVMAMLGELMPYFLFTLLSAMPAMFITACMSDCSAVLQLAAQIATFGVAYMAANHLLHSKMQRDVLTYALGRFRR